MNVHGFAFFLEGLENVTYNVFTANDSVIGNMLCQLSMQYSCLNTPVCSQCRPLFVLSPCHILHNS